MLSRSVIGINIDFVDANDFRFRGLDDLYDRDIGMLLGYKIASPKWEEVESLRSGGVESSRTTGLLGRYDNNWLAVCSDRIEEEGEDKELDVQDTDCIEGMIL